MKNQEALFPCLHPRALTGYSRQSQYANIINEESLSKISLKSMFPFFIKTVLPQLLQINYIFMKTMQGCKLGSIGCHYSEKKVSELYSSGRVEGAFVWCWKACADNLCSCCWETSD